MDTSVELKALVDDMPRRCRFGVRRVNIDSVEFWELDAAGCNEVLKIGEVWAHERVCDFVPVQCKFAGCGVWIRRCNVAAHNTAAAVQHAEGERAARLALERRCAAAQQHIIDAVRADIMRSQRRLADKRRRQTDAAVLADMETQEAAAENALREAERQEVMRSVDRDRRYSVDAAIVSIMKERRHVTHATLVLDVQARLLCLFKPTAKLIKLRIEDMISRDYIERDADDHALYNYLA
jgi:hypothetical protein